MKKLLLFLCATAILFGCSKDDEKHAYEDIPKLALFTDNVKKEDFQLKTGEEELFKTVPDWLVGTWKKNPEKSWYSVDKMADVIMSKTKPAGHPDVPIKYYYYSTPTDFIYFKDEADTGEFKEVNGKQVPVYATGRTPNVYGDYRFYHKASDGTIWVRTGALDLQKWKELNLPHVYDVYDKK